MLNRSASEVRGATQMGGSPKYFSCFYYSGVIIVMPRIINLTGQRKHFITITSFSHKNERFDKVWNARCDCGTELKVVAGKFGATQSCGCKRDEMSGESRWKGLGDRKNNGLPSYYWNELKRNAAARKIPFNITIQQGYDLFTEQNGLCAISGETLNFRKIGQKRTSATASLDRIDSSKGYDLDNVQWVHKDINKMKNTFSESDFLLWIEKIYNHRLVAKRRNASDLKSDTLVANTVGSTPT